MRKGTELERTHLSSLPKRKNHHKKCFTVNLTIKYKLKLNTKGYLLQAILFDIDNQLLTVTKIYNERFSDIFKNL